MELCRKHDFSDASIYLWHSKFGDTICSVHGSCYAA